MIWLHNWAGQNTAKVRNIVEGLAVSVNLLEVAQVPVAPIISELFGGALTFEQYMQLEKEQANIEITFGALEN